MGKINLDKLNSATKYPSIPTYHTMNNGRLEDDCIDFGTDEVILTEKVDGTNVRIIFTDEGFFIGSRTELLHAEGDRIWNNAFGIVPALKDTCQEFYNLFLQIVKSYSLDHDYIVLYGEFYGGKVTAASKQYTTSDRTEFRLFDVRRVPSNLCRDDVPHTVIQDYREGTNGWVNYDTFIASFPSWERVPHLCRMNGNELPTTLQETYTMLQEIIKTSRACIDLEAPGEPEGLIVRNINRTKIAKIRYKDYEKALKSKRK